MPTISERRRKGERVRLFAVLYFVSSICSFTLASISLVLSSHFSMFVPFVPFVSSSSASSSSSTVNRNTYNVYNYDQTTPQFTPDGRLLQVEYASSAADLSPPLVVFECLPPATDCGDDSNSDYDNYPCTVLITLPKHPLSPQKRIVIIEENDTHEQQRLPPMMRHSPTSNQPYCVVMSGILADSLALLQAGMKAAAQHSLQYQTFFGMEYLTQSIADECQSRVFAGGLRPYGSTLLLCGYDCNHWDDIDNAHGHRNVFQSVIYQTDPSGGILQHYAQRDADTNSEQPKRQHRFASTRTKGSADNVNAEYNAIKSQVRCIVGGSPILQRQLHKRITQDLMQFEHNIRNDNPDQRKPSLAERIACVAKTLIRETTESNRTSKNGNKDKHSDNGESSSLDPAMEIVLVSPTLGCHRLDEKQLRAIQELIHDERQAR